MSDELTEDERIRDRAYTEWMERTVASNYCVVKRDLLERAADELEAYADDGLDRGFACQDSMKLANQLRAAARAGKQ